MSRAATTSAPSSTPPLRDRPVRWWHTSGVWLGVGASPAALVLGASLAERRGGALSLPVVLTAAVVAAALLAGQARIGLVPPYGDGGTLAQVLPGYISASQRFSVAAMLALAMAGWLAFNAGLGGEALAALTGTPQPVGVLAFGMPLLALTLTGMRRWNLIAVATVVCALALVGQVALGVATDPTARSPVTFAVRDPWTGLGEIAAFIGYVSVFAVRSPDFTAGLPGARDLALCIALFVVPLVTVVVLGALMWTVVGHAHLVAELERSRLGTSLMTLAMVAPALTAFFSGGLALVSLTGVPSWLGATAIAVPSLLLAAFGFAHQLLPLLSVLGASLPPFLVPMAVEARARRRGRPARPVPGLTWAPASMTGVVLTVIGVTWAPLAGLAVAAAGVSIWRGLTRPLEEPG
jgi:cytosine permease